MEEKFYINWADFVVGSKEIDWLLTEWRKDPKPKTLRELARILMNRQYELITGFLPYDSRKPYKVKDKIKVKVRTAERYYIPTPAEVISYVRNTHVDFEGYTWDEMYVRLLSQDAKLDGKENRFFVANYQGKFHAFSDFEIIPEKDVKDVIPKLLLALRDNKQFTNFGAYWLPSEMLVSDKSNKIREVATIIEKSERPLSTREIIEQLFPNSNGEELSERLEFSLNYFLKQDRIFVQIPGKVHKWDIRIEPPPKSHWTVTIRPEWLEKSILLLPRKLSNRIEKENTIHVLYDQADELLPYDSNERIVNGLSKFYSTKAIDEWDRVHLQLQALEPVRLFISCRWKKWLDGLLKIKTTDLNWERVSLCDCIIVVLSKFKKPSSYREIYTEIADHKQVTLGSVIGTLSRHKNSMFVHAGFGQWQLAGWVCPNEHPEQEGTRNGTETPEISDETWKAVVIIEEKDYVYKLLQKIARPTSFDEICSRLAEYLRVDANQLKATGFLKQDKRFRRLDNGEWALEERFKPKKSGPERRSWANKLLLFWKKLVVSVNRYYSHFFGLIFRQ